MKLLAALLFLTISYPPLAAQNQALIYEPGIISDDGAFGFTLSPDGRTAYWVMSKGKRDTLRIVMAERQGDGKWQAPVVAPFSTERGLWKDIDPMFSPDGNLLIFQSNRPSAVRQDTKRFDVWMVQRTPTGWTSPVPFDPVINTDSSESFLSIANSGNVYYTVENGRHQGDLFMAKRKGKQYDKPQRLLPPLNSDARESNPFIAPDESYLIYAAPAPGGQGDSDLFISFRQRRGWSKPINLGTGINSSQNEFCPFLHPGEDRLYFTRMQRTTSRNVENIYYVTGIKAIINTLRSQSNQ